MGARTLGRYILDRKLATGGMAEIWVAHQEGPAGFQKDVVLKKILPHLAEDQKFIDMFLDEARLAAQLSHPNIVQIFDLGEADGEHFIAMEFIDGRDIQAIIDRGVAAGQPFSPAIAARIVASACTALDYAHNFTDKSGTHVQLVHRDVSPQNILVSKDGIVKLVDFGVAKAATSTHKTQTGAVKGKLSYMSPEQISGKLVDARSDIFALGIVLYELVTGRRPFGHESELLAITAILNEQPQRPCELIHSVPTELEAIIFKALEKDPAIRFQSASEMQLALEQVLQQMGAILTSREVRTYMNDLFSEAPTGMIPALAGIPAAMAAGQLTQVDHPSAMTRPEFMGVPQAATLGATAATVRNATSASVSARISNQVYLQGALADAASADYEQVEPPSQSKSTVIVALLLVIGVLVGGAFALFTLFGPGAENGEPDVAVVDSGADETDVAATEIEDHDAGSAHQDEPAEDTRAAQEAEDTAPTNGKPDEGSGTATVTANVDAGGDTAEAPSNPDVGENNTTDTAPVESDTAMVEEDSAVQSDAAAQDADASELAVAEPDIAEEPNEEPDEEPNEEPDEESNEEPDEESNEEPEQRRPRSGTIQVVSPGGRGTVYIDGRRVGSYPGNMRFTVDAGSHRVRVVTDDGEEFSRSVSVDGGDSVRVRF